MMHWSSKGDGAASVSVASPRRKRRTLPPLWSCWPMGSWNWTHLSNLLTLTSAIASPSLGMRAKEYLHPSLSDSLPARTDTGWSQKKKLKNYNEDKQIKVYINEDLTATRAQLFAKVRKLQKNQFFKQVWTFNGNIKVTDLQGHVKSITNIEDVQKCLPNINIGNYFWRHLLDLIDFLLKLGL